VQATVGSLFKRASRSAQRAALATLSLGSFSPFLHFVVLLLPDFSCTLPVLFLSIHSHVFSRVATKLEIREIENRKSGKSQRILQNFLENNNSWL